MKTTIVRNEASAKKNSNVRCCHCSSPLISRNGTYARSEPQSNRQIRVQRYLCKSPKCPWASFSVLPPPILPVVRHAYKTLFDSYAMFEHGLSQAMIARQLGITRGVAKRLETVCHKFMDWFKREQTIADWGTSPLKAWQDFTRDFSQYFFPGKWLKTPSTQHIPVY